jgi:phosphoacetylglucosamine mutase
MDLPAWNSIYTDLPSRQLKVPVKNKALITCSEDETQALTPPGLQEALDAAMVATPLGRCFVRPSGTEDVVRIYAEAETQELADMLANAATSAVDKFVNST